MTVRGDQVKAYHQFLTGDFGFWIMTSEKPSEARSHPSGCLSLMKDQKKSVSILVTSSLLVSFVVDTLLGFHNESDDEAVANRLVRRLTVYRFFSGIIQSPVLNKRNANREPYNFDNESCIG